jgi:hypothetical protein
VNCLEAQALLSAHHDHEPVSDVELRAARAHCRQCAECTSFANGLKYLDAFPVPAAPEGMTERVMAAVAPLAAARAELRAVETERAEAEGVGLELPDPAAEQPSDEPPVLLPDSPAGTPLSAGGRFVWFAGPVRWATLGAAAALAATALIAFVVIGVGSGRAPQTAATGASTSAPLDFSYGTAGAAQDEAAKVPAAAATAQAPAQAPDYVLYNGFVYAPGSLLADANSATPTIGTLTTAFASGGSPAAVSVIRSPLTDGSIVVNSPDGMRVFAPLIRTLASVRYQLTSGGAIDRFGVWPSLPARFATPVNATGGPSFAPGGTDALGVAIFPATGRPSTEGFALAPGSSTTDPAGGNPGWTWWAPAPTQP